MTELFEVVGRTTVDVGPTLYDVTCGRCGKAHKAYRRHRKPVTCEACTPAESEEHNARVAQWHADRAAERAARGPQPRRKRQPARLYGDLAWVAAVNHIATDGTGRRTR